MKKALLALACVLMLGGIALAIPEDINKDGCVDIKDIFAAAKAYGSYEYWVEEYIDEETEETVPAHWEPSSERWDPICDINGDHSIDVRDIFMIAKAYGYEE